MNLTSICLTLTVLVVASHAKGDVVIFEQGVGGYTGALDINIREDDPNGNGEGLDTITVNLGGASGEVQALLRFDDIFGPSAIPLDATIDIATLQFETTNATPGTISLHRMLTTWDNVTTWNDFSGGVGVSPDGVEAAPLASGQLVTPFVGLQSLDVTTELLAWQGGAANNEGWVLLNNSTDAWEFVSSEFVGAAQRPRLVVEFTAIPEPSALLYGGLIATLACVVCRVKRRWRNAVGEEPALNCAAGAPRL